MPLASTRTIASSAASSSGSATSSTRTSPGAWKVTALTGMEPMRGSHERWLRGFASDPSKGASMGIEKSRPVLITGCSSGIGRATAEHLVDGGWNVYATARKPEAIEELAKRRGEDARPRRHRRGLDAQRGRGGRARRAGRRPGQQRRLQPERRDRDDPDGQRPPAVRDQRLRADADVPAGPARACARPARAGSST